MIGIPPVDARNFGDRMREFALVALGLTNNRLDAFVKVRDLKDAGIAVVSKGYTQYGSGNPLDGPGTALQPTYVVDLTPPPAPTGFTAVASTVNILFTVDATTYRTGNGHARTLIYGATYSGTGPLPTISSAVEITSFIGNVFSCPFDPATNMRLWAKWVSVDGVVSAATGGTNGIAATTGLVDDAKIASLTAAKITAGSITAGQYIQSSDYVAGTSGWRIATLSGGAAFLEVRGDAVFGGTIYAPAGTIGGSTIGSNYIRSTGYVLNTTGWNFNSDGTGQIGGIQIAATYIQSSNYNGSSTGWRITAAGALTAYSGTFAGALSAATGSFAGSLSAATGTFAGSLSAASGTFAGTLTAAAVDAVNTINVAGQAITIPVGAYTDGSITLSGTTTVQTAAITSTGAPIVINAGCVIESTATDVPTVSLKCDGTTIFSVSLLLLQYDVYNAKAVVTLPPVVHTPGSGSRSYTLVVVGGGGGGTTTITRRGITLLEAKK